MTETEFGFVMRPAIEWVFWLTTVTLLALLQSLTAADQRVNAMSGLASIVLGARVFYQHGRAHVTVLGLFNLALGMFIGFAGMYVALTDDTRVSSEHLGTAIVLGLGFQVIVAIFGQRIRVNPPPRFPRREVSYWLSWWSGGFLVTLLLAMAGDQAGVYRGLIESAAFAASVGLAVGLLYRPNVRIVSWQTLGVVTSVGLYVEIFHTGGGRLRVVALLAAISIIATMAWPRRAIKRLMLLSVPSALFLLAQYRLDYQEALAYGASAGRTGLESMIVPIVVFGRLIEEQSEGLAPAWGWNLLSFPLAFLPEGWIANPPQALGYELVAIYSPERYQTGFSLATTAAGEALYNFGLVGVFLAAPLVAALCNFIDRRLRIAASQADVSRVAIVRLTAWVAIGGAIADLAWNGWHVYIVRTLTRLPLIGLLLALALPSRGRSDRGESPEERGLASYVRHKETDRAMKH